jgi:glycosyltransferase involved in cell wall biosynthesis
MAPLVSVLMATRNGERFIAQAIDSVLTQTFADLELVVSDNVSTDSTPDIVQEYAARDPRVRYFRNDTDVGVCGNFNLCYRRASQTSRYLAFLPCDDWWHPSFLSTTVARAEQHPIVAFVHTDAYRTDGDGKIVNRYSELWAELPPAGLHRSLRELYQGCYVATPATLLNRPVLEQLYPEPEIFDPGLPYAHDYHVWLQLLSRGGVAYYLPEPLIYHRKHEAARTMPANTIAGLQDELCIFGEKLVGVDPPELVADRWEAWRTRQAVIGFELLSAGRVAEARAALRRAEKAGGRRLDVAVASTVAALPLPGSSNSKLWRVALAAQALRAERRVASAGSS